MIKRAILPAAALALVGAGVAAWYGLAPARDGGVAPAAAASARVPAPAAVPELPASPAGLIDEVKTALGQPDSALGAQALNKLVPALLDAGGAGVLQRLLDQTPPGPARSELLAVFTFAWSARDPEAALAWCAGRRDEDERNLSLARASITVADRDPKKALALTTPLRFHDHDQAMDAIVERWALQEPSEARSWVLHQPAGEERNQYVSRLAMLDAHHSPGDAATFALKHLPPGEILDETLVTIIHAWAGSDAAGASDWVRAFPTGPLRDRALHEIDGMIKAAD